MSSGLEEHPPKSSDAHSEGGQRTFARRTPASATTPVRVPVCSEELGDLGRHLALLRRQAMDRLIERWQELRRVTRAHRPGPIDELNGSPLKTWHHPFLHASTPRCGLGERHDLFGDLVADRPLGDGVN